MFVLPGASSIDIGTNISNSCRFNDDDSAYTAWTPGGAPDSDKIFTISAWVKRGNLGEKFIISGGTGANADFLSFNSSDKIVFEGYTSSTHTQLITTAVYRDPSAWMHICVAVDTTDDTEADRHILYVNGTQVTAFDTETHCAQNDTFTGFLASGQANEVGRYANSGASHFDGYLAEVVFIDGTKLTPSSFGHTSADTGEWVPSDVSGLTFGTKVGERQRLH
jgi:hypothetical protein